MNRFVKIPLRILLYLFLLAMLVFALFPVVYILLSSFKTNAEIIP